MSFAVTPNPMSFFREQQERCSPLTLALSSGWGEGILTDSIYRARLLRFTRNDRSPLATVGFQDFTDAGQVESLGLVAITADDRRRHRERVEDGLLRGLHRRLEQRI